MGPFDDTEPPKPITSSLVFLGDNKVKDYFPRTHFTKFSTGYKCTFSKP